MEDYSLIKSPCRRDNLIFEVVTKEDTNPQMHLVNLIIERFAGVNGIVYCHTQQETADLAFALKEHHVSATYYHGGMEPGDKVVNASLFMEGKVNVMCATTAFGMGIDKKDVRFVIHYSLPSTFEDMVQESGRAGRDGDDAYCIILFRFSDRMGVFRNIAKTNNKESRAVMRKSLNDLTLARFDKTVCRQQLIARYFQEDEGDPCLLCDNCQKPDFKEKQDLTANAKQIIDCLRHLTFANQRIRMQHLSQTYIWDLKQRIS